MYFIFFFLLSILSKGLAFGRELGIAWLWGPGYLIDGFILSMMLPILFVDILSVSLNASFVKSYNSIAKYLRASYITKIFVIVSLFSVFSGGGLYLLLPNVYEFLTNDPKLVKVAMGVLPYSIIYFILNVFIEYIKTLYLALEKQAMIPITTIVGNIFFLCAIYFYSHFDSVADSAVGFCFVVLSIGQILTSLVLNIREIRAFSFNFDNKVNYNVSRFIAAVPQISLGSASSQLNKLVDKSIAVSIGAFSLSSIYFTQQLYSLVINLIVVSLLMYLYPKICKSFIDESTNNITQHSLRVVLFVVVFPCFTLMLFTPEIVKLVYGYGEFSNQDVNNVSKFLFALSFGLVFESLSALYKRFFWGRGNTKTPVIIGIILVVFNITLSVLLSRTFGVVGVLYATSISHVLGLLMLSFSYKKMYCDDSVLGIGLQECFFILSLFILLLLVSILFSGKLLITVVSIVLLSCCYFFALYRIGIFSILDLK